MATELKLPILGEDIETGAVTPIAENLGKVIAVNLDSRGQIWAVDLELGHLWRIDPDTGDAQIVAEVEGAVAERAREVLEAGAPVLVRFGVTDEQAWEVGLTCGGTIEIFVEPQEVPARVSPATLPTWGTGRCQAFRPRLRWLWRYQRLPPVWPGGPRPC